MLLSVAFNQYITYLTHRRNAAETTVSTYKLGVSEFIAFLHNKECEALTIHDVDSYADSLQVKCFTSKTLKNKLTMIRGFVRFMYAREYVQFRPELIELPKVFETEATFLTELEVGLLLGAIKDRRDKALVHFMLATGMRVNEVAEARLHDLYERSVVVRKGKGNKPRLTFQTPASQADLNRYLKIRGKQAGYLFPNPHGQKLSRQLIGRKVTHYGIKAGITKPISPHTLRHTFATMMLRRGARVEDVQKLMGHANIRTTIIYLHFTDDYLKERYDLFMLKDSGQSVTI